MNERQYLKHLADIERRNPGEPLLSTLKDGFSRVNCLYMGVAIKRLPTEMEPDWEEETEAEQKHAHADRAGNADETLRKLWAERTRLFGEMNKQSNEFHKCKTDADRVGNSTKVLGWWKDIQAAKARIEYYEQHGEMPKYEEEGDELSDNPALLAKQLGSLRARISQTQKKIADLAGLDPNTPGKEAKIADTEAALRNLKHLKGLAEQKMKSHEQEA
jgi:hypothetical protein